MIARLKQNFRDLGDRDGQFYEYEDLELMEKLDRTALRERRLLNGICRGFAFQYGKFLLPPRFLTALSVPKVPTREPLSISPHR